MKKIIISALMTTLLLQFPVIAEENTSFNVYTSKTEKVISKIEADVTGTCVAAIFLGDNSLFTASPVTVTDGIANVSIPYPENDYTFRLYYDLGKDKYLSVTDDNIEILPDIPVEDDNTDSEENEAFKYPAVYETAAVANGAFAVVKKAEKTVNEADEVVDRLTLFYMGTEINLELNDRTKFIDEWKYGEVNNFSELIEGDVVSLSTNLSGKIISITLLFRNFDEDLVADEAGRAVLDDAQDNIFDKSVVYGIITNKMENKTLVISDGTGLDKNAQYIGLHPETVVYYYDKSLRNDKLIIGTLADVQKSDIPSINKDEDGNITLWEEDNQHNYAFARVHDDVICDIVVYGNY